MVSSLLIDDDIRDGGTRVEVILASLGRVFCCISNERRWLLLLEFKKVLLPTLQVT